MLDSVLSTGAEAVTLTVSVAAPAFTTPPNFFFFEQKTAYEIGLGIPAEPLLRSYNVLPQLDINNTIDHRPEGDEKWFLENEKTVTQFCRKLAAERPLKDIRDEYNYPKKKGIKDECSRLLEASTMKSRRGFAIQ